MVIFYATPPPLLPHGQHVADATCHAAKRCLLLSSCLRVIAMPPSYNTLTGLRRATNRSPLADTTYYRHGRHIIVLLRHMPRHVVSKCLRHHVHFLITPCHIGLRYLLFRLQPRHWRHATAGYLFRHLRRCLRLHTIYVIRLHIYAAPRSATCRFSCQRCRLVVNYLFTAYRDDEARRMRHYEMRAGAMSALRACEDGGARAEKKSDARKRGEKHAGGRCC